MQLSSAGRTAGKSAAPTEALRRLTQQAQGFRPTCLKPEDAPSSCSGLWRLRRPGQVDDLLLAATGTGRTDRARIDELPGRAVSFARPGRNGPPLHLLQLAETPAAPEPAAALTPPPAPANVGACGRCGDPLPVRSASREVGRRSTAAIGAGSGLTEPGPVNPGHPPLCNPRGSFVATRRALRWPTDPDSGARSEGQ